MFEFVALLLVSATFGTEPFEVEAKLLSASRTAGVYHAKGDVVLRRPGLVAYADRMTFYEKEQRVEASGNVVLVEGLAVTRCSKVILKVPELVGGLASAELRIKKGITPYELSRTPKAELSYAGEDDVLVNVMMKIWKFQKNLLQTRMIPSRMPGRSNDVDSIPHAISDDDGSDDVSHKVLQKHLVV